MVAVGALLLYAVNIGIGMYKTEKHKREFTQSCNDFFEGLFGPKVETGQKVCGCMLTEAIKPEVKVSSLEDFESLMDVCFKKLGLSLDDMKKD
jgi:hypothetical protein